MGNIPCVLIRKSDSSTSKVCAYDQVAVQVVKDEQQDKALQNMPLSAVVKRLKKTFEEIPPQHIEWRRKMENVKEGSEEVGTFDFYTKLGVETTVEGRSKAAKESKEQEIAEFNAAALPIFNKITDRYLSIQKALNESNKICQTLPSHTSSTWPHPRQML